MKPLVLFALVLALAGASNSAQEAPTTYDAVLRGMTCQQNPIGDLECDYRVGRSLHFGIAGVGRPDASIYFYAASFEGDYFAAFGLVHGCVIVRPGHSATPERQTSDLAFVSPRNGQVFPTYEACRESK